MKNLVIDKAAGFRRLNVLVMDVPQTFPEAISEIATKAFIIVQELLFNGNYNLAKLDFLRDTAQGK